MEQILPQGPLSLNDPIPEQEGEFYAQESFSWGGVRVEKAEGIKCPRCRKRHRHGHLDDLCARCFTVVQARI
jgi:hypothetical protein